MFRAGITHPVRGLDASDFAARPSGILARSRKWASSGGDGSSPKNDR